MSNVADDADLREQVCDWLRANGINPCNVPGNTRASVADGQLTVEIWDRNGKGQLELDPATDQPARRTVTVPVVVPPPTALVENWLAPRCPACGR